MIAAAIEVVLTDVAATLDREALGLRLDGPESDIAGGPVTVTPGPHGK